MNRNGSAILESLLLFPLFAFLWAAALGLSNKLEQRWEKIRNERNYEIQKIRQRQA